jgi:hypothetical protein
MCLDFSLQICLKIFCSKKKWARSYSKYPLLLSDFNETWIIATDFRKKSQISNFIKIRPVEPELIENKDISRERA